MRKTVFTVLTMLAGLTTCSEPSDPTDGFEAVHKSVHRITAIDLQFPGDGAAFDNNNRGEIVGLADVFGVWRKDQFQPLPLPPDWDGVTANAIDASGAIVGVSVQEGQPFAHGILYEDGVLHDLGVLPGDAGSEARAINAGGDIVGISITSDLLEHAVLWRKGQIIALGALPGDVSSAAWGIDNAGRVVGESRDANANSRPFVWHNGVMTELTQLEQPGIGLSFTRDEIAAWTCPDAKAGPNASHRVGVIAWVPCPIESPDELIPDIEDVNASGQAVGTVLRRLDIDHLASHGYLWSGGKRILLPPVAGEPDVGSEPHAINDQGDIVGHTSVGATLWTTH
jgi:probable HAF family extracellular repeat protein